MRVGLAGHRGATDATTPLWTALANLDCSTSYHLYCFGADRDNPLVVPKQTPVAFLSNPTVVLSLADFDRRGRDDAQASSIPGTFRAAVATTTVTAMQRVSGGIDRTWYRRDGTKVASTSSALLLAPLDVTATGSHVADEVFFGAATFGDLALSSGNSSDWTAASAAMTSTGDTRRSSGGAFRGASNVTCTSTRRVYCFQID